MRCSAFRSIEILLGLLLALKLAIVAAADWAGVLITGWRHVEKSAATVRGRFEIRASWVAAPACLPEVEVLVQCSIVEALAPV